jgi:hypothetical protein
MASPFDWKSQPSVLAPSLRPYRSGKTASMVQSETVDRITRETGRNPGTVDNLAKSTTQPRKLWLHKSGVS